MPGPGTAATMSAANKNSAKFEPIKAMSFVGWLERSGPNLRATNSESDGFHLKIHTKRVMSHKEFLPGRGHMHQHAVFSSLSHGTPLAASIESSEQQRLAWIGVYPLDLSRRLTQEFLRANGLDVFPSAGSTCHITTLEAPIPLIETYTQLV